MPESPPGPSSGQGGAGALPSAPGQEPAPDDALELPATFGKYFLTEKLATGGMAEIYLAKIVGPGGFEKQLVIKQIHPKLSGQRHFVDLFVAEAKTLVTLAHGNIVPVYELGVIDDTYFIAMEYIDGPTLYRLTETLQRKDVRMEPAIAAWITARVLEGLDYAHRKGEGVIHRDLSPRNVMLSRDGEVKLVDFGIAVALGADGEEASGQSAPTGSFPYMSPEQVRKEPLTVQTDLFSVGVLLWEMLVGHRLFARSDPDATLSAVVDGDIARPSTDNPEVPARLDEVVMRALERDMTARWTSAGDMIAALQRYLYSLDDTPGPRDLAALVARYCPPETRRLPTHHDLAGEPELPFEATQQPSADPGVTPEADASAAPVKPGPRTTVIPRGGDVAPVKPGPMTAVIPREAAQPRGKRSTRARTETFATHVALEEMLEHAGPASPDTTGDDRVDDDRDHGDDRDDDARDHGDDRVDSGGDDRDASDHGDDAHHDGDDAHHDGDGAHHDGDDRDRDDPTPVRPRAGEKPAVIADPSAHPGQPPIQLSARMPPAASLLLLAGFGALGLAAASVYVFYQGRGAVLRPDATPRHDAPFYLVEPDATPATSPTGDAAEPPSDAAERAITDAPPSEAPRDAGIRLPRPDAREPGELTMRLDAGAARPTGNATLTIGANPWGNVLLDGKPIGRTPIDHLSVPAGHHVVQVIFGGEDPPRTLSYTIDLASGEAKDLLADFTRP
jgi:eukaryotic-like serine/threonine-protein kinase